MAKARSSPIRPAKVPLPDNTKVPRAINELLVAWRRVLVMCRFASLIAGIRPRVTRMIDQMAPTMITSAATPEPTAAKTRGATPNSSLPFGMVCPPRSLDLVGAISTTPTATPDNVISHCLVM